MSEMHCIEASIRQDRGGPLGAVRGQDPVYLLRRQGHSEGIDMPPSIALEKLAGVKTVPAFQCWRNGQVVGEMVSACDRSSLLASLSEMVQRLA